MALHLLVITTAYTPGQLRSEPAWKLANILKNTAGLCAERSGHLTTDAFHFSFLGLPRDISFEKGDIVASEVSMFAKLIAEKHITKPMIRIFDRSQFSNDQAILFLIVATPNSAEKTTFFEVVTFVDSGQCIFRVRATGIRANESARDQFAQLIQSF